MFRKIYVPVDNSDYSNRAIDLAVELGRAFGSTLTGCHVYAARLHDYRFKQMEYTLPEEYRDEHELERQRKIHDSLIAMGLQLVSDSYLEVMRKKTEAAGLPFEPRMMDGKHYKALIEDVQGKDYDLVIMGALGLGAVRDSQLGSVTERFIRKVSVDTLVIRSLEPLEAQQGAIVVGLDGSPQSFYGLKVGIALGKALRRPVHAVAVYDPYLHYAMFNGIVGVLTEQASKVFRFKEQEQLHEEIIDTGLAKIYQSHLEIGRKLAADEGVDLAITLLDGKCFEKVLQFCRKEQPWLLILGRIGVHSDEREADLGSNTENLLRLAPCNVLLVVGEVLPAARREGRGDHRVDGRGPGADEARPGAGGGRRAHRAPPLRDRAGAHRHHVEGHRRGDGDLHARPDGREDADPRRGPGGGEAPRRERRGDGHLLGVRLRGEGAERGREMPGVRRRARGVHPRGPQGGGADRDRRGRDRRGGGHARRDRALGQRRPRGPARGDGRLPPPARQGADREVRADAQAPGDHEGGCVPADRGDGRARQARRRLGHAHCQHEVRPGDPQGRDRPERRLHLDRGRRRPSEPRAGRLHARHDPRGDREGGAGEAGRASSTSRCARRGSGTPGPR